MYNISQIVPEHNTELLQWHDEVYGDNEEFREYEELQGYVSYDIRWNDIHTTNSLRV